MHGEIVFVLEHALIYTVLFSNHDVPHQLLDRMRSAEFMAALRFVRTFLDAVLAYGDFRSNMAGSLKPAY